jgi:CDP-glycerol glycerophosphotransferase (TagB/SpsB family)
MGVDGAPPPPREATPVPGRKSLRRRLTLWLIARLNDVTPKSDRKIAVHSVPDFEDGALAVLEGLLRRGHRPLVLAEDARAARRAAPRLVAQPVQIVSRMSARGVYHYLTSRHVITTHGLFPSGRPGRGQNLVNIWHGEPLTKPVGRWEGRSAIPASLSTTLSGIGKAFRAAEFALDPSQVLVLGAPRNDRLLQADREAVRRRLLGDGRDPTMFLWLPTYRSTRRRYRRDDGAPFRGVVPLDAPSVATLDEWLARHDAVVFAKAHPLAVDPAPLPSSGSFRVIDAAFLADAGLSLYDVLAAADCLISDVSSVWIDFLLTDRPLIFMFPDFEQYRRSRGLHLEPYERWIPGPLVTSPQDLIAEMDRVVAGKDDYAAARADTRARLHRHVDAGSTDRLLDALQL